MIGQVVEAVVGNRCQVLRGGRKDGEWAVVSRHVRDLQVGDMVRVFEDRGQLWVVALIGTGPVQVVNLITPPPPLTETQPVQRGTEVISPAWSGTSTARKNSNAPRPSRCAPASSGGSATSGACSACLHHPARSTRTSLLNWTTAASL